MKAFKLKTWQLWTLVILLCVFLYQISGYFLLYCNDAYVDANFVVISPRISGEISEVPVIDNQFVHRGDVILKLDPTPFALSLAQNQASYQQAQAQIQLNQLKLKDDKDSLVVAKQQLDIANQSLARFIDLEKENAISKEALDTEEANQHTVLTNYLTASATVQQDEQSIIVQTSAAAFAKSAMDLAAYNLSLATIKAPVDGYINNLRIRPGNYVSQDTALFGLVAAHSWYIIANYKEAALKHLRPGQTVWIMLSSNFGHIYTGKVESYTHAVARDATPNAAALPYVAPTTDWIRYPYRFPVTISIPDLPLTTPIGKGADARTIIFVL